MASLRTTREALFIGHAGGFITDAEFLLLHQENSSDNLDFPYDNYPRFSLQDQSEADCKANFRLEKHHVGRLVDALQIPAIFKLMCSRHNLRRFGRPLYPSKTLCIPMPVL